MRTLETQLLDQCLRRTSDLDGVPYTREKLIKKCEGDIRLAGREATTDIYLKGERGRGLKNKRRLLPNGPLGKVLFSLSTHKNILYVQFPSVALLDAVADGPATRHSVLASYYLNSAEALYPREIPFALASQLAAQVVEKIVIADDVVESIWQRSPNSAHSIVCDLLEVEDAAHQRRWKHVDLKKWMAAGLGLPVVSRPKKTYPQSSASPKSEYVFARLSPRQAHLIALFNQANEHGKQIIEAAAAAAEASRPKK